MKKIILILIILSFAVLSFAQGGSKKYDYLGVTKLLYSNGDSLISPHPDSVGEYRYMNAADPTNGNDLVNLRYLSNNPQHPDSLEYVDFYRTVTTAAYREGRMYYDSAKGNVVIYGKYEGTALDAGKEFWIDVYNPNATAIQDAKICVLKGNSGEDPSIQLAIANTFEGINNLIGASTHLIPAMSSGVLTTCGSVSGFNTTGRHKGDAAYISAVDSGEVVYTPPAFPYNVVQIGVVDEVGVNGSIIIGRIGYPKDIINNIANGSFNETFDFIVSSDGTTITGSLTNRSGGDYLTMNWSDGFQLLDVSPAKTLTLPAGQDSLPQQCYVYILKSTGALTYSTSYWPSSQHIPISQCFLQSASMTQALGKPLRNQNINNHIASTTDGMGALDHIRRRLRATYAVYETGLDLTTTDGATPDISLSAGKIWQLHLQDYQAYQLSTDKGIVINNFGSKNDTISYLTDITTDAAGGTLNNRYFNIVLFAVQNSGNDKSNLCINMPTGTYANISDVELDADQFTVSTIPKQYRGVAVLLYRLIYSVSGGEWTLEGSYDLRGQIPVSIIGGGSSGSGGTATSLLALTDFFPTSYAGQAKKLMRVSDGETGVEFSTYTIENLDSIHINKIRIDSLRDAIGAHELADKDTSITNELIDSLRISNGVVTLYEAGITHSATIDNSIARKSDLDADSSYFDSEIQTIKDRNEDQSDSIYTNEARITTLESDVLVIPTLQQVLNSGATATITPETPFIKTGGLILGTDTITAIVDIGETNKSVATIEWLYDYLSAALTIRAYSIADTTGNFNIELSDTSLISDLYIVGSGVISFGSDTLLTDILSEQTINGSMFFQQKIPTYNKIYVTSNSSFSVRFKYDPTFTFTIPVGGYYEGYYFGY